MEFQCTTYHKFDAKSPSTIRRPQ